MDLKKKGMILFKNGEQRLFPLEELPEYIVEKANPGNHKEVQRADIYLPQMESIQGICMVDTPGLGSVFSHNNDATRQRLVNIGAALVAISAERPLAEEDLLLIDEIRRYALLTYIVLSKTDLFGPKQLNQITEYLKSSLSARLHFTPLIQPYSLRMTISTELNCCGKYYFRCNTTELQRLKRCQGTKPTPLPSSVKVFCSWPSEQHAIL